jgi:hypothetical protein
MWLGYIRTRHFASFAINHPLRLHIDSITGIFIYTRYLFSTKDEYQNNQKPKELSRMGNALLSGWKEIVLGSALWLLAVPFQIWIPRSIILAIVTFGTALWIVGIVNICTTFVRDLSGR